jgi:hypothetical protein
VNLNNLWLPLRKTLYDEMREIVAFIIAAEDSRTAGGASVPLRGVEK